MLGDEVRIGNFVETKNTRLGHGSKVNHLSYVGDAELGINVNVGAGTITCNYDGFKKHITRIGDGAFIGSNSSLICVGLTTATVTTAQRCAAIQSALPWYITCCRCRETIGCV